MILLLFELFCLNVELMPFTTSYGVLEDQGNKHLWRSTNNGTETHTSAIDEFVIGQLQAKDFIDTL